MRHATVHHGERGRLLALLAPLLVVLGLHVGAPLARAADSIYWTAEGAGTIRVGNLDGIGHRRDPVRRRGQPVRGGDRPRGRQDLLDQLRGRAPGREPGRLGYRGDPVRRRASLCGVAINPAANKIYWADFGNDKIRVGNLDGTGTATTLFSTLDAPSGVAIDPAAGKIYWTDQFADTVEVANLDGTGTPAILFGPSVDDDNPIGLAIDTAAGKIYWTALASGKVRVGNQDGSGSPSTLFGSESTPGGVAIDPAANKIYWDTFSGGGTIRVANLDGSGTASTLFGSEGSPLLAALLRAPVGTAPPTISGTPEIGEELTCSQGDWAADLLGAFLFRAPRTFAYQWQKDGNDIVGADRRDLHAHRDRLLHLPRDGHQPRREHLADERDDTRSRRRPRPRAPPRRRRRWSRPRPPRWPRRPPPSRPPRRRRRPTTTTTTRRHDDHHHDHHDDHATTTTTTLTPRSAAPRRRVGCRLAHPGASSLQIKDSTHDTSDQFKWKWARGAATAVSDFMDPGRWVGDVPCLRLRCARPTASRSCRWTCRPAAPAAPRRAGRSTGRRASATRTGPARRTD